MIEDAKAYLRSTRLRRPRSTLKPEVPSTSSRSVPGSIQRTKRLRLCVSRISCLGRSSPRSGTWNTRRSVFLLQNFRLIYLHGSSRVGHSKHTTLSSSARYGRTLSCAHGLAAYRTLSVAVQCQSSQYVFATSRSRWRVNAVGLSIKKDMDGNRVMKKMSKPRKLLKAEKQELKDQGIDPDNVIVWHVTEEDVEKLHSYCKDDVLAEHLLSRAIPELPPDELKLWQIDQDLNVRGVLIDLKLCRVCTRARRSHSGYDERRAVRFDRRGSRARDPT